MPEPGLGKKGQHAPEAIARLADRPLERTLLALLLGQPEASALPAFDELDQFHSLGGHGFASPSNVSASRNMRENIIPKPVTSAKIDVIRIDLSKNAPAQKPR